MCDVELHGKKFTNHNDTIFCEECYIKFEAKKCHKCKESIGLGSIKVTLENKSWHKECFVCKRCKIDLKGEKYYLIDEDLFCKNCNSQPVAQCHECKLAIKSTVSHIKHKQRLWHAECFKCVLCKGWLANGEFQEMDDTIMCNDCYSTKVSKKCSVCHLSVAKGVLLGISVYHKECFVCSVCKQNLVGASKVADKNGQPICQECKLKEAKKCFRCNGPITTRHTVYRGQTFHIECFKCNLCGSSIDNSEFYETSLNEILCAKCARIN